MAKSSLGLKVLIYGWLIIVFNDIGNSARASNDFENPSSNAESEDETEVSEDWIPTYRKKTFQCLISDSFRKKRWEFKRKSVRFVTNCEKTDKYFKTCSRLVNYLFISLILSCSISVTDEERWFYQGWFHQSGSRPNRDC